MSSIIPPTFSALRSRNKIIMAVILTYFKAYIPIRYKNADRREAMHYRLRPIVSYNASHGAASKL